MVDVGGDSCCNRLFLLSEEGEGLRMQSWWTVTYLGAHGIPKGLHCSFFLLSGLLKPAPGETGGSNST